MTLNSILTQQSVHICFDQLTAAIRPQWEAGPVRLEPLTGDDRSQAPHAGNSTAIHAHIFYLDLLPELLDAWANVGNRELLLNTDCTIKAETIRAMLNRRGEKNAIVRVMQNRGRDIAPMLVGWRDIIKDHDILVHCHTKRTPHAGKAFGEQWRQCLVKATFPEPKTCSLFQALLSNQNHGFIMPWPHQFVAHNVNWGCNFVRVRKLMQLLGFAIERHTLLQFPAGSFFWARVDALQPLLDLGLRWNDFAPEPIGGDGFLAHALERCLGLLPTLMGRMNHAYWGGPGMHGLHGAMEHSGLVALPELHALQGLGGRWLDEGLAAAMAQRVPLNQSLRLSDCSADSLNPS